MGVRNNYGHDAQNTTTQYRQSTKNWNKTEHESSSSKGRGIDRAEIEAKKMQTRTTEEETKLKQANTHENCNQLQLRTQNAIPSNPY